MILKKLIFILIHTFIIIKVYSINPTSTDTSPTISKRSGTAATVIPNCSDVLTNTYTDNIIPKYCIDDSLIKIVTNAKTIGSTKFGKSGTPSGNFFFANSLPFDLVSSGSGTTNIIYSCNSSGCKLISDTTGTYFNSKASGLACAYSLATDCKTAESGKTYYDSFSEKVISCSGSKCTLTSGSGYYIDYGIVDNSNSKYTNLIKCTNNSCKSINNDSLSTDLKEYYINAGLDKSSNPIIKFDTTDKYKSIPGNTSGVYLDYDTLVSENICTNIIVCSSTTKCTSVAYDSGIFLNAGDGDPLIKCSSTGCQEYVDKANYTGANSKNLYYVDGLTKKLIKCISTTTSSTPRKRASTTTVTCEISNENTSGKYYLDYSTESTSSKCNSDHIFNGNGNSVLGFCSLNVISCNASSYCSSSLISTNSQFIDGDTDKNLIICASFDNDFFCTNVKAVNLNHYYINSGNDSDYPLLYCGEIGDSNATKCTKEKASTHGYYITDNGDTINDTNTYNQNYYGYLISCSSSSKCELSTDIANDGYYVNAGVAKTNKPLIKFDSDSPSSILEDSPKEKDSYYLDASSLMTNTYSNLIYCSTTSSCESITPNDGYYYNADQDDNDTEVIIKCDKTGCNYGEPVQPCCPDEETILKAGNYCYQREKDSGDESKDINFVINEFIVNSESIESSNLNITYTSSGSVFKYVTVLGGNFPGITNTISTLFEIKPKSITRVVSDSVYIINSRDEKVESYSGSINIGKTYSMYECSSSTQLCVKTQSCVSGTYFFDAKNNKGYQCNGVEVIPITEEGYYVNSSYIVNKNLTPNVLKCNDNGHCETYTPKNTYFINAGSDNTSKPLIHCSTNNCQTQEAAIGYYRAEFGKSGVIVCTSSINCKISSLRYNYYINSGEDKVTKPIIGCTKSVNCETKRAYIGHYLIQENNNLLINCKTSSTCEVEEGSVGYYYNSANNENPSDVEKIIKCYVSSYTSGVVCITEKKNEGFYLSGNKNNVLVNCMDQKCKTIIVENGIFRSAASLKTSVKNVSNQGRSRFSNEAESDEIINRVERFEEEKEIIKKESNVMLRLKENHLIGRASNKNTDEPVSTLINCSGSVCNELTAEDLNAIPICTYNNDMCYIDNSNVVLSSQNKLVTSVVAGDFCTDSSRSTIYFATETIVEYNDVISGVLSTSKTTTKNCIKASSQYSSNLFTVGNRIFKVSDGLVMEFYDKGYYFININKNTLVYGTEIKEYNKDNVLLYKCDGSSCRIMDKPTSDTFYTDVSKRIIKYSVEENKYSFINKKENICMFSDNTCTPKYDIGENDFCVTAEGNIVIAGEKIKSRETGKCFMSSSINENVLAFSYNSVLYLLNSNAAKQVVTSGYYFADNNKYNSAEYKAFNTTTSGITLYGCVTKNCKIYEPKPDVYYFDMITNYLIQKKDNDWISPIKVGYIYTSINPEEEYIYSYTMTESKELLLTKTNKDGWYYTIDGKMYQCYTHSKTCTEIKDSGHILTNSNEIYYCVVDSEGEETECFKRTCTIGQIYYIKDNYYKCTSGSYFELIRSKHCDHDEVVVINFPLIYSDTFPISVYNTISNIAKNNHHVPTQKLSRSSLETFQGVFTNCTYNAYDEFANYEQICMENYVKLNQDKEPDICSVKLLGYTYCTVEDGDNPDKCNPSSAIKREYLSIWHAIKLLISIAIILIIF